jgi:hypothetical protein
MASATPLQLAIEYSADNGAEDEIDKLINMANEHKIPATSPVWTEFVSDRQALEQMQSSILNLESALLQSQQEIRALKESPTSTVDNISSSTLEPISRKTVLPKQSFFVVPSELQIVVGFLTGALLAGLLNTLFFVPNQVSSQLVIQRTKDKEILAYLNTKEGVAFRRMLAKNGSYFPHQCEAEAKRQKLSILVNSKKTTRLCVLALPD